MSEVTRADRRAEVEGLLERLRACSLAAFTALEAGRMEAMTAALREREQLTRRAGPLLDALQVVSGRSPEDREALGHELLRSLRGIEAADRRLRAALEVRQGEVRAELEEIAGDAASGNAYVQGDMAASGKHLNLVR